MTRRSNTDIHPRSGLPGGAIIFVLLNVEIADAYSTGQTIGIHMGASLGEDMTYSLGMGRFRPFDLGVGHGRALDAGANIGAGRAPFDDRQSVSSRPLASGRALPRGVHGGLGDGAPSAVSFLTQRFILRGDRS